MRIIFIGDLHIEESSIQEIKEILEEIFKYGKADGVIQLGDFFDSSRPTPKELEFGTWVISEFKKHYKNVIVLSGTGRHNWLNGVSVIEYLKHLNATPVGITYNTKIDGLNCLFGHFMTNQSKLEYGTAEYTIKQLKKYDLVMLGHQHQPEKLTDKIYHIGSIRYQHWNEVSDKNKQFAILENGKLKLIPLKTPIPMIDVYFPDELSKIKKRSKVRLIIKSWEDYKNWVNDFSTWEKKFVEFKVKKDYGQPNLEIVKALSKKSKSLQQFVAQWFKKIKDKEIVKLLEKKFKEEGLI